MINIKIIKSKLPILINGEPGVGKSYRAKRIHNLSERNKFITYHLGTMKSEFIESDLFGHVKGSFTGACEHKKGLCDEVNYGTLFLDEIGELNLSVQAKILELLEEGNFRKLGSNKSQHFLGRLLFATNKNLDEMVKKGEFRQDLLDRINFFEFSILPLRNNRIKISEIIFEYQQLHKMDFNLSNSLKVFLATYHWPGNIRELNYLLDYFKIMNFNREISTLDLPQRYQVKNNDVTCILSDYHHLSREYDLKMVKMFLKKNNFKINKTTKMMNISKNTLLSKIKKYNINISELKLAS